MFFTKYSSKIHIELKKTIIINNNDIFKSIGIHILMFECSNSPLIITGNLRTDRSIYAFEFCSWSSLIYMSYGISEIDKIIRMKPSCRLTHSITSSKRKKCAIRSLPSDSRSFTKGAKIFYMSWSDNPLIESNIRRISEY